MNKVDKLLKKLEDNKIGENIDEMFLNMIIDINERLKIIENENTRRKNIKNSNKE